MSVCHVKAFPQSAALTLNQIEDLVGRIRFFTLSWPLERRGTRLAANNTNTHPHYQTHTQCPFFPLFLTLDFCSVLLLLRITSCPVLSGWAVFTVKSCLGCSNKSMILFLETPAVFSVMHIPLQDTDSIIIIGWLNYLLIDRKWII